MRQYNIPNGGYVPIKNVTYLLENDTSQINRIPLLQDYEGYAIVTVGPIYLNKQFNWLSMLSDYPIISDQEGKVFILNCSHDKLRETDPFSQKLNSDNITIINSLTDYFNERQVENENLQHF